MVEDNQHPGSSSSSASISVNSFGARVSTGIAVTQPAASSKPLPQRSAGYESPDETPSRQTAPSTPPTPEYAAMPPPSAAAAAPEYVMIRDRHQPRNLQLLFNLPPLQIERQARRQRRSPITPRIVRVDPRQPPAAPLRHRIIGCSTLQSFDSSEIKSSVLSMIGMAMQRNARRKPLAAPVRATGTKCSTGSSAYSHFRLLPASV